ncbi:MAG TPA: hypothetical protein VLI92_04475 [Candidatus Saccharimonadales bacterium]|nr:hypothetical protein [Candidatus Saccharimonadales bacterium]
MLNGAILIFGGNDEARSLKTTEILRDLGLSKLPGPDVLIVETLEDKRSISIDQIKSVIKFVNQKPFEAKFKAVVIPHAQKITPDGQNALLKTLEEPPAYATIALGARNENDLLPTVQSRCQKIKLDYEIEAERVGESSEANSVKGINSVNKVLVMPIGERLSWAEIQSKEEKDEVLKLLESWVEEEHKDMISNPKVASVKKANLEYILKIKDDLEKTNVNLRLALEHLVLNLI